jgi:hypothetical protein
MITIDMTKRLVLVSVAFEGGKRGVIPLAAFDTMEEAKAWGIKQRVPETATSGDELIYQGIGYGEKP